MYYQYLIAFAMAFILAFATVPLAKKIACSLGVIDVPKSRGMHRKPVPLMGGLAVFGAFMLTLLVFAALGVFKLSAFPLSLRFWMLLAGCVIIEIIGVSDDVCDLSYKIRMPFQLLAAVLVATQSRIEFITNPFNEMGYSVLPGWISWVVTILWIVGMTNATNLIDGLDGLSSGLSAITAVCIFTIALMNGDVLGAFVAAVLLGSVLGFLPYNLFPASIFIGDSGAPLMGFILAAVSIGGSYKLTATISVIVPMFVMIVPLFDTASSIIRRVANGQSPMQADRQHLHHKLVDLGFSQKEAVLILYAVCMAFGVMSIVLTAVGPVAAIGVFVVLAIAMTVGFVLSYRNRSKLSENAAPVVDDREDPFQGHRLMIVTSYKLIENIAPQAKACVKAGLDTTVCVVGRFAEQDIEEYGLIGIAQAVHKDGWLDTVMAIAKEKQPELAVVSGEDMIAYGTVKFFVEETEVPVAHLMKMRTKIRTAEENYIIDVSTDTIRTRDLGETDEVKIGNNFLDYLKNNIFILED
ncbi:MAG: undecaprenyl/decaprenyl-phosphate alpha-N-acetylglucosaminyl 1-phosphate transferase [Clostridia bacterium]|nr:undecaprenyl/decaprenyl-phosphate alpha-N-acetylglucosaminyl 1-phosphate transferase [Clostridia bacterium]